LPTLQSHPLPCFKISTIRDELERSEFINVRRRMAAGRPGRWLFLGDCSFGSASICGIDPFLCHHNSLGTAFGVFFSLTKVGSTSRQVRVAGAVIAHRPSGTSIEERNGTRVFYGRDGELIFRDVYSPPYSLKLNVKTRALFAQWARSPRG